MDNLQLKFLEHGGRGEHSARAGALVAAWAGIERGCKDDKESDFHGNRESRSNAKEPIDDMKPRGADQELGDCIIAGLVSIDYEGHVLIFENTMGKKPLKFKYRKADPSLMKDIEKLSNSKKGFFELHGDIKIKKSGSPSKIKRLSKIREVNLGKVVVTEIPTKHGVIAPQKPLVFHPRLCDYKSTYIVDISPFGGILYEQTRDYLVEEIHQYLSVVWDFYAMEEDDRLDQGALEIKRAALQAFKLKNG